MAYSIHKTVTLTNAQWAWVRGAVLDAHWSARLKQNHYEGMAETDPELVETAAQSLRECYEALKEQTFISLEKKGEE
jgi:hypothetical protein